MPNVKSVRRTLLALALFPMMAAAHDPAADMAATASEFVSSLTPAQQAKAQFDFGSTNRTLWFFVPRARPGLPIKEMTPAQRELLRGLLGSALSQSGRLKVESIMALETVLRAIENKPVSNRDPEMYYITLFGTPGPTAPWGWRLEGHHLSVSFTLAGGRVIGETPSFLGANPARIPSGDRAGERTLALEDELGLQLVQSLDAAQRRVAVLDEKSPDDIVTSNLRKVNPITPDGLAASAMTPAQRDLLHRLVRVYLDLHRPELAETYWSGLVAAGLDQLHFAWAGADRDGAGHYYRIQGPTFLIEFDNTRDKANHIHSVWRDFKNDFGDDLLRRHYEAAPHAP